MHSFNRRPNLLLSTLNRACKISKVSRHRYGIISIWSRVTSVFFKSDKKMFKLIQWHLYKENKFPISSDETFLLLSNILKTLQINSFIYNFHEFGHPVNHISFEQFSVILFLALAKWIWSVPYVCIQCTGRYYIWTGIIIVPFSPLAIPPGNGYSVGFPTFSPNTPKENLLYSGYPPFFTFRSCLWRTIRWIVCSFLKRY